MGNAALSLAARGRVDDMGAIRQTMTEIGATARQAALLGEDDLAEQARKRLVDALVAFSRTFKADCYDQTFDPRIALGLARQNELLDTGVNVTPCANRNFTAAGSGSDMLWTFAHCGLGIGEWQIKTEGQLVGSGIGLVGAELSGAWTVDENTPERDIRLQFSGTFKLILKPVEGDSTARVPDQLQVQVTQGTSTTEAGVFRRSLNVPGLFFTVKNSDKPCRLNRDPP
jgi:hypothetical protein